MVACKALALTAVLQFAAFPQSYNDKIRPVFEKNCLPCHGPQTKAGGLDLSTRDALLKGGEHGPVIVAGDPKASLLCKLIAHEAEPHMPYKSDRLPQAPIDAIGEWIKTGASFEQAAVPA